MCIKKISIILPTYKPQDYLWECLDSIKKQTINILEYELIIILNGCSEPYRSEIQNYINSNMQDYDIKIITISEPGVSNARNVALNMAIGEYICFIDDDDYISPSYLQELLQKSSKNIICLSNVVSFIDGNNFEIIDSVYNKIFRKYNYSTNVTLHNVRQYLSCPVMKLIHRDMIRNNRFDVRFKNGEDTLFMFSISDKIKTIVFTSSNAVYYRRIRPNSATTSKRSLYSKMLNALNLVIVFSHIYWRNCFNYNFMFYVSRVLGTLKPRSKGICVKP